MLSFSKTQKLQERDNLIKESLLRQLSYSVKEIQLSVSQKDEVFSTSEGCSSLITILEAIFLHGLKKGIVKTALRSMSGEDVKPQISFWNMVCNYTHKDTISTIKKLPHIKTDVGRCRVWLRVALNEAELTSYFTAMEKDRRPLNSYYSSQAFLRDRETCDTVCKFLEGILIYQFEIPTNSSILNVWNSEPLMLSGVWCPPMKTPLGTAVDVAERIEDIDSEDETSSIKTSGSVTTLSTILALDESQALKMILETTQKKNLKDSSDTAPPTSQKNRNESENVITEEEEEDQVKEPVGSFVQKTEKEDSIIKQVSFYKGNSLANAPGWSYSDGIQPVPENYTADNEKDAKVEDYTSLLEKVGISPGKTINYEERLQKMKQTFEEKSSSNALNKDSCSFNSYTSKLYKISREISLKAQKYTCASCKLSIGLSFGEARLCYFTGEFYCNTCHTNETNVIPSRLIFNWDHKKYPVCSKANKYLSDICNRLLIDVGKINPKIYNAVPEMKALRSIRIQLNMLRAYLYTCKESLLVELQKKVSPREYLYEFVDHYTVNDLCQIPGGMFATELSAIVLFGKNHVITCCLCSQKGFICEICKNSKVIYPFDVSTTYRCRKCFAIYHDTCLSSNKKCPKCSRIKLRLSNASSSFNPE